MTLVYKRSVHIARSVPAVFAWHENPAALHRLTPPWERVQVVSQQGGIRDGARVVLKSRIGPLWVRWEVEHFDYREGKLFCDRQVKGPFAEWTHYHRFEATPGGGCQLTDEVHYRPPGGVLAGLAQRFVADKLERLFAYRHAITKADLELPPRAKGRVVVSGSTGLLGAALVTFLRSQGWTVDRLVRRSGQKSDEIEWNPHGGDVKWPEGYTTDAVIHLAGANVAAGRWTSRRRTEIMSSRVEGTRSLVAACAELARPPRVFLSGSATGFYGDRGDQKMVESSQSGGGYLAEVCRRWEDESRVGEALGMRVINLRTGVVLSPGGGALAKMLPAFWLGIAGRLGSGRQWLSWIGLEDWLRACVHLMEADEVTGPVNLVAPFPVRNADFTAQLGRVLRRPTVLALPGVVLRGLFGQMADETLLASTRVVPDKLTESGFEYLHPELDKVLMQMLGMGK